MKTIVAFGLMALFLFMVVVEWGAYRPSVVPASASASQIYIHGTPVCVFRHGESIVARIGECGTDAAPRAGEPGDGIPNDGAPALSLPPGHPPVNPDMDMIPDGGDRRVLI